MHADASSSQPARHDATTDNDAVERLALDLVRFGTLGFQAPYRIVSSPTLIGA